MEQQLITRYPAGKAGSSKSQTSITRTLQPQQISAAELAGKHRMEFPSTGLAIVMDEQEGPVAVHAEDLVSTGSYFLTDSSGQILTVQPMMGG
jgi:hypothetical protein